MAVSDKLTQAQIATNVRREVMDSGTLWVSAAELNQYIEDWQDELQNKLELVWTTATFTNTGSATLTMTDVATDVQRVDAIYWENRRLLEKSKDSLEQEVGLNWRAASTSTAPLVYYMNDSASVSFWPPPDSSLEYTLIFEYPPVLTFAATTNTHMVPAWTKYTATTYGAMRVFQRRGALFNSDKFLRYKALWEKQLERLRVLKQNYFPKRSWSTIPGKTKYETDMYDLQGSRRQYE